MDLINNEFDKIINFPEVNIELLSQDSVCMKEDGYMITYNGNILSYPKTQKK